MREIIEINSILKDFYDVSGIRISIHDTEFNEIYSSHGILGSFSKVLVDK